MHGAASPGGPCCLPSDQLRELAPRGVVHALGKMPVLHHGSDAQVFHDDDLKRSDDATGMLMSKVAPFPPCTLMGTRHHLAALLALLPGIPFCAVLAHRLPHLSFIHLRVVDFGLFGDFRAFC
jgi:hypothetical protein